MLVCRSRTNAPVSGNLTLCSVELEEVKSLRILEVTLDSKLTFKTHLPEVVSKAVKCLGFVRRAELLFDCPRELTSCFSAYVLSSLEYWSPSGCLLWSLI